MSSHLKIGSRLLDSDQMISALVQYKLLEPLVGHLLLDEVFKEVPLLKQEVCQAMTGQSEIPENFEHFIVQWCEQKNITLEYFQSVIVRDWQLQKFKQLQFASQVESEFLRMKPDLDQVEYSLIQVEDQAFAQELYFQIRDDGVEIAQLAREHSLGSEKQSEGWVGPVALSSLPIDVFNQFRHQKSGVVYPPVSINGRFWIVRLERLIAARLTDATRAQVIDRLYNQWLQTQIQKVMNTPGAIAVHSDSTSPVLAAA